MLELLIAQLPYVLNMRDRVNIAKVRLRIPRMDFLRESMYVCASTYAILNDIKHKYLDFQCLYFVL